MDFATIIREARTSSGRSQHELAQEAGISLHAVWEIENRGNGTVALLTKVCSALDLRFAGLPRGKTFAEQVRALRLRRGWSQERLAERARVSAPAIIRLERGNARISTLSAALSVLAPGARVRKPDVAAWGTGARDERFTSPELLERIVSVVGPICLDPCGHRDSAVRAERIYYLENNGLAQPSSGVVYVNPPYSGTKAFIEKARQSWQQGHCQTVLLLLQTQTHHRWFHREVVGHADVFFLNGRIAFDRPGKPPGLAPFGNKFVLYGADRSMIERMLMQFDCVHLPRSAKVGRVHGTVAE